MEGTFKPSSFHVLIQEQTLSKTYLSSSFMKPFCSKTGMNLFGAINPFLGDSHLTKASVPIISPVS